MHLFAPVMVLLLACRGGGDTQTHHPHETPDDTADTADTGDTIPLARPQGTVSMLADGQLNHLLPVRVALDPKRRRAWSVCNGMTTLAEVDIDNKSLVGVFSLGQVETSDLRIYADGLGVLWLRETAGDPLLRVDPDTLDVVHLTTDFTSVDEVAPLPAGGLLVSHSAADRSTSTLVWIGPDGTEGSSLTVDGVVIGIAQGDDNEIGVLTMKDLVTTLLLIDNSTQSVSSSCVDPEGLVGLGGFAEMTSIGHGNYAATEDHAIATMGCTGAQWNKIPIGEENRSPIWADDALLVLDRIGPSAAQNANWGVARRYNPDLTALGHAFQTGKNSGYGDYDAETNRVWMNSEGTSELWSFEPSTGTPDARVRLGAHVESVVANPDDPDVVWFTGRLWNTVGRVDVKTGETLTASDPFVWPMDPVYVNGRLWVWDHVLNTLYGLNPDTLAVEVSALQDLTDNITLTFDDLAWDADRGSFFVSASRDNVLLELNADTGAEIGRWDLAGDPVADPNLPGRLEVLVAGNEILVVRDNDGTVTVVNPATGETRDGLLDHDTVVTLEHTLRLDRITLSPSGTFFWAGADAYDLDTLTRDTTHDLGASYAIGPFGDGMLAYDDTLGAVVSLDASGARTNAEALAPDDRGEPAFQLLGTADGLRLTFSRFSTAEVVSWVMNPAAAGE